MKTSDKPTMQDFHIDGVRHIHPGDALEALMSKEAVLIDVREPNEIRIESVPLENVLYHPLSLIMDRLPYIAKDQNIILGCTAGIRSSQVANLLNRQEYPNVANLDGGFKVWKSLGYPFKTHLSLLVDCGCGCGCSSASEDKGVSSCC